MIDRLTRATQRLVAKFRRQRPIRSGSLLITLFGDAIAPRGGVATLGSLIQLAAPFGIAERLVRTSVGRLAQEGWLASRRKGRQSEYFLTEHGRSRFAEATQRIYGPVMEHSVSSGQRAAAAPHAWDGGWTVVLLLPGPRAQREHVREQMAWLGFGQIGAGVLAHPTRSVADTRSQLADLRIDGNAVTLRATSGETSADRALLRTGWDLAELTRSYRRFVANFAAIRPLVATPAPLPAETAFLIRTLLIHEYRRIHLRDPLLPHSLLPADWIGATAYDLCRDLYRHVFAAAEQHVSTVAATLTGKLPAPSRETYRRFGGLDLPLR